MKTMLLFSLELMIIRRLKINVPVSLEGFDQTGQLQQVNGLLTIPTCLQVNIP